MGKSFVVSVMSKDRPGIIAAVTTVVFDLGGDLADLNQSVLGGYFTMILIAEFDESVQKKDLLEKFSAVQDTTAMEALINEMEGDYPVNQRVLPRETYVLTAQAQNRKGLVKCLGDFFYSKNINVLDLVTTSDKDMYTMIFQVDLTEVHSMGALRNDLKTLGEEQGLQLVLQHNDIYMATNEVGTALETIIGV